MVAKDDYVVVLDFLSQGKPQDRKGEPLAQAIGEKFFNLLEVIIKDQLPIKPKDRLYIGEEKREEVKYIRGRINFGDLTSFAKGNLEEIISELIDKNEKRFVEFFNKSGSITTRIHTLELLPGIGKKHMWQIIDERKKKKFESFKELQERIEMLPDPKRMVIRRIIDELEGKDNYRIFVSSEII